MMPRTVIVTIELTSTAPLKALREAARNVFTYDVSNRLVQVQANVVQATKTRPQKPKK